MKKILLILLLSSAVSAQAHWAGRYVVEAGHVEETPGEVNGVKYDRLRHVFTLSFPVSEGIALNAAP